MTWADDDNQMPGYTASDNQNLLTNIQNYKIVNANGIWLKQAQDSHAALVAAGAGKKDLTASGNDLAAAQYDYLGVLVDTGVVANTNMDSGLYGFLGKKAGLNNQQVSYNDARAQYQANDIDEEEMTAATKDLQAAQYDLYGKLYGSGLFGSAPSHYDDTVNAMDFWSGNYDLENAEEDYNTAYRAYNADPTPSNYFDLEIAELELQNNEYSYQQNLMTFVPALSGLMGYSNYANLLDYKQYVNSAKISKLHEKLAAEEFKAVHGVYPTGREQSRFGQGSFNQQNKFMMYAMLMQ